MGRVPPSGVGAVNLQSFLEKSPDADLLREMIGFAPYSSPYTLGSTLIHGGPISAMR